MSNPAARATHRSPTSHRSLVLAGALALASASFAAGAAGAQILPGAAGERVLSPAAESLQHAPALGLRKRGFFAAWQDDTRGILGRAFTAAGVPAGGVAPRVLAANPQPPGVPFLGVLTENRDPALAMRADGSFLVVWTEHQVERHVDIFQDDHVLLPSSRLMARLHDASGQPLTAPFAIAAGAGGPGGGAVAAAADGSFWVSWHEGGAPPRQGIHLRRIGKDGKPAGADLLVAPAGLDPAVAVGGNVVAVAWLRPAPRQVMARLYAVSGSPVGKAVAVPRAAGRAVGRPAVAGRPAGNFLVAWDSAPAASPLEREVHAQLLSPARARVGAELVLGGGLGDRRSDPQVALSGKGWVASWMAWQGPSRLGVLGLALDVAGRPKGPAVAFSQTVPKTDELSLATSGERVVAGWVAYSTGFDLVVKARTARATL